MPAYPATLATTRRQEGFTIIEVLVAALVLTIGIVSLVGAFDPARRLGTRAQLRQVASARAEAEINRITSLPFNNIAMETTPTVNGGATKTDPTFFVKPTPSSCPGSGPVSTPCYQWDWKNPSKIEALDVEAKEGKVKESQTWETHLSSSNGALLLKGTTYSFVTWATDTECKAKGCGGENDYRRAIVAVTIPGMETPVELTAFITNPVGEYDPIRQSGVYCTNQGVTGSCIG